MYKVVIGRLKSSDRKHSLNLPKQCFMIGQNDYKSASHEMWQVSKNCMLKARTLLV